MLTLLRQREVAKSGLKAGVEWPAALGSVPGLAKKSFAKSTSVAPGGFQNYSNGKTKPIQHESF
jgi:hypothetical protein